MLHWRRLWLKLQEEVLKGSSIKIVIVETPKVSIWETFWRMLKIEVIWKKVHAESRFRKPLVILRFQVRHIRKQSDCCTAWFHSFPNKTNSASIVGRSKEQPAKQMELFLYLEKAFGRFYDADPEEVLGGSCWMKYLRNFLKEVPKRYS